jgi:hypothetical protein
MFCVFFKMDFVGALIVQHAYEENERIKTDPGGPFLVYKVFWRVVDYANPFVTGANVHSCDLHTDALPAIDGYKRMAIDSKPHIELGIAAIAAAPKFSYDSHRLFYHAGDTVYVSHVELFGQKVLYLGFVLHQNACGSVTLTLHTTSAHPTGFINKYPPESVFFRDWQKVQNNCRAAIMMWSLCAKRIRHMCKDMRIMIARHVWESRNESDWESWKFI